MESLVHRRLQVILAALLALATLWVLPAYAEDPPYEDPVNVTVDTGPDAVTVDATTTDSDAGGSGTGDQASGGSGPTCVLRAVTEMDENLTMEYFKRRMRYAPYYVVCNGEIKSIVWIEITNPGEGSTTPPRDPEDIARELRDRIPSLGSPSTSIPAAASWAWNRGSGSRATTAAPSPTPPMHSVTWWRLRR